MITRWALFSNAFVALLVFHPQLSFAQEFTSADALEWSEEQQDGYFQASVTMLGIVAAQSAQNVRIAECIDTWHGGGDESQPARSAEIRRVMEGLPEYHPQAVILAIIEKECGDFR